MLSVVNAFPWWREGAIVALQFLSRLTDRLPLNTKTPDSSFPHQLKNNWAPTSLEELVNE